MAEYSKVNNTKDVPNFANYVTGVGTFYLIYAKIPSSLSIFFTFTQKKVREKIHICVMVKNHEEFTKIVQDFPKILSMCHPLLFQSIASENLKSLSEVMLGSSGLSGFHNLGGIISESVIALENFTSKAIDADQQSTGRWEKFPQTSLMA
jgi:hypothetical protein